MRLILFLVFVIMIACQNVKQNQDPIIGYLDTIIPQGISPSITYVLVSDYSCSACKEKVYLELENGMNNTKYVILDPRQKMILKELFPKAIRERRLYIDSLGINKKMGIFANQAIRVYYMENKWIYALHSEYQQ